jgi:hypothetical protein
MEKYLAAATRILDEAIPTEPLQSKKRHFNANLMEMGFNADGDRGDGWMPLGALEEDGVSTVVPVAAGDYIVRVQAFARTRGGDPLKLTCMVDNSVVNAWDVNSTEDNPGIYEMRLGVSAGKHRFKVLNRRIRGGQDEFLMKNGRIGREQQGVIWVKWVEIEGPIHGATVRYPAAKLASKGIGQNLPSGGRLLDHEGEVSVKFNVPKDGEYLLRAQAYADQAGQDWAKMDFRINGQSVKTLDVTASGDLVPIDGQRVFSMELLKAQPYLYEVKQELKAGEVEFSAAFLNDHVDPTCPDPNLRDRNLYIDYLEVVNLDAQQPLPPMPQQIKTLFASHPVSSGDKTAAARGILSDFATKAYRRPVPAAEIDGLMNLFAMAQKNGDSFESSIKLPMKAVLLSPHFLFRGEVQPDPDNPKSIHPVDEYALASRLSYFLWSSMPDDELISLASKNQLRDNLEAQVKRMLADPKSQSLVENFAGQWLQTRNLKFVAPDKDLYPDFDESLRHAMETETLMFFGSIMREDRSVLDFLNADYTFVNERLAKHYGIENVKGEDFRKVSLEGTPRRGLLTQGSMLTITSNPTRTSPVKRGKWVLENMLGTPPPPPPPDVPELKNDGHPDTGTLRQQMEQHRANPACASCHARMDPIGFGLETFDGIGKYREKDGEAPVDASGQLVTGETFKGPTELAQILATKKREDFIHCLAEKMLTYALGRGLEYYDGPACDKIAAAMEADDNKFSTLIMEVVKSTPFQMRRGDAVAKDDKVTR